MIKYWEDTKCLFVYTTTFFYTTQKLVVLSREPKNEYHLSRQVASIEVNNIKINKVLLERGFII